VTKSEIRGSEFVRSGGQNFSLSGVKKLRFWREKWRKKRGFWRGFLKKSEVFEKGGEKRGESHKFLGHDGTTSPDMLIFLL